MQKRIGFFWVLASLFLLLPITATATASRINLVSQTTNNQCVSGLQCPVLAIPGAIVQICNIPGCASIATTYTDSTAMTSCPTFAQVTLAGSALCTATTDNGGGGGVWINSGTYNVYLTLPNGTTLGPYPFSAGGTGGGGGGVSSVGLVGTSNQITVTGASPITSTGSWTLTIPGTFTFPGTVTNNLSIFGPTTSAQLRAVLTDETGTGAAFFAGGNAGTPSAIVLTNGSGLPVAGLTGLGTGVGTALGVNVSGSGAICLASGSACSAGGGGTVTVVGAGNLGSTQFVTGGGTQLVQTPSSLATLDSSGNALFTTVGTGGTPPTCGSGTAGCIAMKEGSSATPLAGADLIQADSVTHQIQFSLNGNAFVQALTASNTATVTGKSIAETQLTFTNNTSGNVSTAAHGFVKILPNDASKFYDGTGAFSTPPGAGTVSVDGPFFPFGKPPVTGVALFTGGDMPSTTVIVDQFVSTVAKTVSIVTVGFTSALTSGHAFLIGYYDHTCSTLLAFGRVVGAGGGTNGAVTMTLNTPLSLSFGITYNRAVASQDEVNPLAIDGGVTSVAVSNGSHFNATTMATFSGGSSTLPTTCPAAGNGYYSTIQENLQN